MNNILQLALRYRCHLNSYHQLLMDTEREFSSQKPPCFLPKAPLISENNPSKNLRRHHKYRGSRAHEQHAVKENAHPRRIDFRFINLEFPRILLGETKMGAE